MSHKYILGGCVVVTYLLRPAFLLLILWELMLSCVPATAQNLPGIGWHIARAALLGAGWWFTTQEWTRLSLAYYQKYHPEELE